MPYRGHIVMSSTNGVIFETRYFVHKLSHNMRDRNIYGLISLKISAGGEKSKKHKVFFEDPAGGHSRIQFDGCPYIIVGRKVYHCQHGVDRHAKEKQRNQHNSQWATTSYLWLS